MSDRSEIDQEIAALRAQLARLEARVRESEANEAGEPASEGGVRTRRDLLRLAGAAAVGAAGAAALSPLPAAATTGTMQFGTLNSEDTQTKLSWTSGVTSTSPSTQQSLLGAMVFVGQDNNDGLDGYAAGASGYGVTGQSDVGYGVVGATNSGVDLAALGTGRLEQRSTLSAGPPAFQPPAGRFEMLRDSAGVVWVSGPGGSPNWRRINSTVPIAPARAVDTRNATGGFTGPLSPGGSHTWQIGGTNGVPTDAIGLVGNLTAVGWNPSLGGGGGFLVIYPGGTGTPGASTVNYQGNVAAWANGFVCSLGTGVNQGQVTVFNSNNTTCHVIVDVTGYII